jgi:hypothetical protein
VHHAHATQNPVFNGLQHSEGIAGSANSNIAYLQVNGASSI